MPDIDALAPNYRRAQQRWPDAPTLARSYDSLNACFNGTAHGLVEHVKSFVESCPSCQRNKHSTQRTAGLLMPLPIPNKPWEHVTMDFIVKLPKSKDPITDVSYDLTLVLVDQLTNSTTRFGEHHLTQRNLQVGIKGLTNVVQGAREAAVVLVKLKAHTRVLGALAG